MSRYLFQPGHIDGIIGFGAMRPVLTHFGGSANPAALASMMFGLAAAGAYLSPLIGGFISDRLLTRCRAVILGAACCAAGQMLFGFAPTFLIGLMLVLAGAGLVGVNIATQLGDLYERSRADLADAFQAIHIFNNLARIAGVLVCGGLGQTIAWHWGYIAAACAMMLGLSAYAAGQHYLPAEPSTLSTGGMSRPGLAKGDGATIAALLALWPALILIELANGQIPNAYLVWGDTVFRLQAFGQKIPSSWLVAADSAFSVAASIAMLVFWQLWARLRGLPNDLTRIAIGAFLAAAAPLVLSVASAAAASTGHRVSLGWAAGFHTLDNLGMAAVGPIAATVFARMAPRKVAALMMGVLNADSFGTALAVGYLGTLLPRMGGTRFWLLQAGLVAIGGACVVLLRVGVGEKFRGEGKDFFSEEKKQKTF